MINNNKHFPNDAKLNKKKTPLYALDLPRLCSPDMLPSPDCIPCSIIILHDFVFILIFFPFPLIVIVIFLSPITSSPAH